MPSSYFLFQFYEACNVVMQLANHRLLSLRIDKCSDKTILLCNPPHTQEEQLNNFNMLSSSSIIGRN
jgi:hypothetical protein